MRAVPGALPASVLPGLSGLALGLTFTPLGGPLVPFVAFAPVAYHLSASGTPGTGLKAGFVTSVVAHGIGLHWMVPALSWRSALAVPTYLAVLALIGVCGAAALESVHRLRRRARCPLPLALALTWVAFEWVAARVPGVAYAWLNAGSSLVWHPELSWIARVGGGSALTLWTVLIGSWIGVAAARRAGHAPGTAGGTGGIRAGGVERVAFLVVALAPVAAGVWEGEDARGRGTEIQAVQPGREAAPGGLLGWEDRLRRGQGPSPPDLVVFPERFLDGPPGPDEAAAALATRLGSPVLFGGMDLDVEASGDTAWYNAAFLVEPGIGSPQVVHKRHLVPGLEDGGSPGRALLRLPGGGYRPGSAVTVLDVSDRSLGVLICYDSAFPSYARALVGRGADLLIVLSNDDWLDPAGPARATVAYWQHETQGRLRARENGVPLVQVAATGKTFAVDSRGRALPLHDHSSDGVPLFASAVVRLTAGAPGPPSPFSRSGDILGPIALLAWILGAWPGRRRRTYQVPNRS